MFRRLKRKEFFFKKNRKPIKINEYTVKGAWTEGGKINISVFIHCCD